MKFNLRFLTATILILAILLLLPQISQVVVRKPQWLAIRAITTSERYGSEGQPSVYHWKIDGLKQGGEERSASGKVIAKLEGVESYEDGSKRIALLEISVLSSYNPVTKHHRFKSQDLLVGSNFEFIFGDRRQTVQIVEVNPPPRKKTTVLVMGVISWQKRWFADAVRVGDQYSNPANGEVLAKVISKKILPPQEKILSNSWEAYNKGSFWDIEILLELTVDQRGDNYFFAYLQPVKIGNLIHVPMDKYNLYDIKVKSVELTSPSSS